MSKKQNHINKDPVRPPLAALRQLAGKYSRRPDEADDLVQDLLLESVRTSRDISDQSFMPWAHGFLRKQAAFVARTEGRRREREKKVTTTESTSAHSIRLQFPEVFIDGLSPALRKTARLINCGLNKEEMIYLLDISDASLRQRFTALRKEWQRHLDNGGISAGYADESDSPLDNGLLRRSLRNAFRGNSDKVIGSFDPDGHLLIFRQKSAHKKKSGGNN